MPKVVQLFICLSVCSENLELHEDKNNNLPLFQFICLTFLRPNQLVHSACGSELIYVNLVR